MGCQVSWEQRELLLHLLFLNHTTLLPFLLPVRLYVMLIYRSKDGKRKKKSTYICIALTCCPSPLFFNLKTRSFFSLLLVALIGLGGAVVFEMLGSHGVGERRADCTNHQEPSLFQATRSIVKTHFRHKKQLLLLETGQAQENWSLMNIHLSRRDISAKPLQNVSAWMALKDTLVVQGERNSAMEMQSSTCW